jgi:hypothetical protein
VKNDGVGIPSNCCHPAKSIRTKCVCGHVLMLRGAYGNMVVTCLCGRQHRKASLPGGAFAKHTMVIDGVLSTGRRRGGKDGCPGIGTKPRRADSAGVK